MKSILNWWSILFIRTTINENLNKKWPFCGILALHCNLLSWHPSYKHQHSRKGCYQREWAAMHATSTTHTMQKFHASSYYSIDTHEHSMKGPIHATFTLVVWRESYGVKGAIRLPSRYQRERSVNASLHAAFMLIWQT